MSKKKVENELANHGHALIGVIQTPDGKECEAELRTFLFGRGKNDIEALADLARILRMVASVISKDITEKKEQKNG